MPRYNREQFIARAKLLLQEMADSHEDMTGVGPDEEFEFSNWLVDLQAAEDNT